MLYMKDINLNGKRVLIREDLNVPVKNGEITSDARLQAALPTIRLALQKGAKVILMSHLGRPVEGEYSEENSLAPVANALSKLLNQPVRLEKNYLDGIEIQPGEIVLCENVRFNVGEKKDDSALGQRYAALCDVYVMDAFATAHRAQASTHAVARFAPTACAGPLLAAELAALKKAFAQAEKPSVGILGGAKISTKLLVLEKLCLRLSTLIVGGGIANNFLAAAGFPIGKSLAEPDLIAETKHIMTIAKENGCAIPLPIDVITAPSLDENSPATCKQVEQVQPNDMILDIGPETIQAYADILMKAKSILWNGPVGAFEITQFSKGTEKICQAVAASSAFSVAGGGDTLSAINKYKATDNISYLSTGGGAFLEFLEGKELPAVAILNERG